MVYHCSIAVDEKTKLACGTAILPLKTQTAGPAPHVFEGQDVVDEAIYLFRSNVLFRKYDVKGPADRTLIYLTLYINACLKATADAKTKDEAKEAPARGAEARAWPELPRRRKCMRREEERAQEGGGNAAVARCHCDDCCCLAPSVSRNLHS